jgi:hypothetical protein
VNDPNNYDLCSRIFRPRNVFAIFYISAPAQTVPASYPYCQHGRNSKKLWFELIKKFKTNFAKIFSLIEAEEKLFLTLTSMFKHFKPLIYRIKWCDSATLNVSSSVAELEMEPKSELVPHHFGGTGAGAWCGSVSAWSFQEKNYNSHDNRIM